MGHILLDTSACTDQGRLHIAANLRLDDGAGPFDRIQLLGNARAGFINPHSELV